MEIVNYVMKHVVRQGENPLSEKHITEILAGLGYHPHEIDSALKLLSYVSESLKIQGNQLMIEPSKQGQRVFSPSEEKRFTLAFRNEVLRLAASGLLTKGEIEELLLEAYLTDHKEVGLRELDLLLHKVIKDEERLLIIAPHLSEEAPSFLLN